MATGVQRVHAWCTTIHSYGKRWATDLCSQLGQLAWLRLARSSWLSETQCRNQMARFGSGPWVCRTVQMRQAGVGSGSPPPSSSCQKRASCDSYHPTHAPLHHLNPQIPHEEGIASIGQANKKKAEFMFSIDSVSMTRARLSTKPPRIVAMHTQATHTA